jgi:uncharacterized protein YuzE
VRPYNCVDMEASYDPEVDAAYLRVRASAGPNRTEIAEDGTVIDCDHETGDVLGYELLFVVETGLEKFQTVPEAGRQLVSKAIDAARLAHRYAKVTDSA